MRWHWVVAAVLLGGVVWWTASQSGGGRDAETDHRAVRDEIAASPAVVATFVRAGATDVTFTFTLVREEGWVWDPPDERDISNRLISSQQGYLLELRPGCSIATTGADQPLIPGLNVAERLVATLPQERRDATTIAYNVDIGGSRSLSVTEDLAAVETSGWFRAKTAGLGPRALIGEFTIRAATKHERAVTTQLIRDSGASSVARIEVDKRYVYTGGHGEVFHETWLVAEACPDVLVNFSPPEPGQRPEALSTGVELVTGAPPTTYAATFDIPLGSSESLLEAAARAGFPSDVRIHVGARFFSGSEKDGLIAHEVTACEPKPWFAC